MIIGSNTSITLSTVFSSYWLLYVTCCTVTVVYMETFIVYWHAFRVRKTLLSTWVDTLDRVSSDGEIAFALARRHEAKCVLGFYSKHGGWVVWETVRTATIIVHCRESAWSVFRGDFMAFLSSTMSEWISYCLQNIDMYCV